MGNESSTTFDVTEYEQFISPDILSEVSDVYKKLSAKETQAEWAAQLAKQSGFKGLDILTAKMVDYQATATTDLLPQPNLPQGQRPPKANPAASPPDSPKLAPLAPPAPITPSRASPISMASASPEASAGSPSAASQASPSSQSALSRGSSASPVPRDRAESSVSEASSGYFSPMSTPLPASPVSVGSSASAEERKRDGNRFQTIVKQKVIEPAGSERFSNLEGPVPAFRNYAAAYYNLFVNPDLSERAEECLKFMSYHLIDDMLADMMVVYKTQIRDLNAGEMAAAIKNLLGGRWAAEDGKLEVHSSYLHHKASNGYHGLLVWALVFCSSCFLGTRHAQTQRAIRYMVPELESRSKLLNPESMAFLALAMPHWTATLEESHTVKPRPHTIDLTQDTRGKWKCLYDMTKGGRSLIDLQAAVIGFRGPTLLVISTSAGDVFGAYLPIPWEESTDYTGTRDHFLFTLKPKLSILPTTGAKENYFYFNATLDTDESEKGLGFGGSKVKKMPYFRLFLDQELAFGASHRLCTTYTKGPITSDSKEIKFDIEGVEVWGYGDAKNRKR